MAFVLVAVATRAEGFTTLAGIAPALVFHSVTNLAGLGLLGRVKRGAEAAEAVAA
jgi:hypothetical protein